MPGIFDQLYIHLIFSIRDSASTIRREWRQPMMRTFAAIMTVYGHQLMAASVQHDHVHILIRYRPGMLISTLVSKIKKESAIWLKEIDPDRAQAFRWQKGYAVFTVSRTRTPLVRKYIAHQDTYHATVNLKQEMEVLLDTVWEDRDDSAAASVPISMVAEPSDETA
jgi:REP element-mobilizing transposase RayT